MCLTNMVSKVCILIVLYNRLLQMASNAVPDDVLMNGALIRDLEAVAKDIALLQGVLMRTKETPNSSEVNFPLTLILKAALQRHLYICDCTTAP